MNSHAGNALPDASLQGAARAWLTPVRAALGDDFIAAHLTGGVLAPGFDPARSGINVLVIAHTLDDAVLDRVRPVVRAAAMPPRFDPLFLTRRQMEHSLDSFPIELLDLKERHWCFDGDDFLATLVVPQAYLRLQCERELRGKFIQMRQAYLLSAADPTVLATVLEGAASSFGTLFRTLLRLQGEAPPTEPKQVVTRIAAVFGLDAAALLGPHHVRYAKERPKAPELPAILRAFLAELNRLVTAVDAHPVALAHPLP